MTIGDVFRSETTQRVHGQRQWDMSTARELNFRVTDILSEVQKLVTEKDSGDTKAFSEEEFLPFLVNAILCRGEGKFSNDMSPPKDSVLLYVKPSDMSRYFPYLIPVKLGDGHPELPTTNAEPTSKDRFSPLRSKATFSGRDTFWRDLGVNKTTTGGPNYHPGLCLLSEFYRQLLEERKAEERKAGRKQKSVSSGDLAEYICRDDTKRNYINMEYFYESKAQLTEQCKTFVTGDYHKELQEHLEPEGYQWGETSDGITCALKYDKLHYMYAAAQHGMNVELFERLKIVRKHYQEWRSGLVRRRSTNSNSFEGYYLKMRRLEEERDEEE